MCKAAGSIVTNYNEGTRVCRNCATVIEENLIDESSEWRNFNSEHSGGGSTDMGRVGGPVNMLLSNGGVDTMISGDNGELNKWSNRLNQNAHDKSMIKGICKIRELASDLNIPKSVQEDA